MRSVIAPGSQQASTQLNSADGKGNWRKEERENGKWDKCLRGRKHQRCVATSVGVGYGEGYKLDK